MGLEAFLCVDMFEIFLHLHLIAPARIHACTVLWCIITRSCAFPSSYSALLPSNQNSVRKNSMRIHHTAHESRVVGQPCLQKAALIKCMTFVYADLASLADSAGLAVCDFFRYGQRGCS
eukprot:scpid109279/ scgid32183/ 